MHAAQAHALEVRNRLRNPPNPIEDLGIDLRRRAEPVTIKEPEIEQNELKAWPLPMGIGKAIPLYALSYGPPIASIEARQMPDKLRIRAIQRSVCQHYGVTLTDMLSQRRDAAVMRPRQIAVWLCKKLTGHSLPMIGRHFGRRDHTTILHSVRKIEDKRLNDAALDAKLTEFIAVLS